MQENTNSFYVDNQQPIEEPTIREDSDGCSRATQSVKDPETFIKLFQNYEATKFFNMAELHRSPNLKLKKYR